MATPNHPFVVWGACFLWFISMFAITWSLILFLYVSDMLLLTGTDLINAIVLLSGIIMLPTNVYILCAIANSKKIDHKSKVVCCPLWLCILWIILINCIGVVLCSYKLTSCKYSVHSRINSTIKHYRSVPRFKHFIDNMQWSLRCCGLNSYKDWFNNDWYDKIRDYEWDPQSNQRARKNQEVKTVTDSVPLSCCKTGSCISNYLLELGTSSINTRGCGDLMHRIVIRSMITHLIMFLSVIIVEVMIMISPHFYSDRYAHFGIDVQESLVILNAVALATSLMLKFIIRKKDEPLPMYKSKSKTCCSYESQTNKYNVKHIMSVKDNFSASSASLQLNPDDSDEFEKAERRPLSSRRVSHVGVEKYRDFKKVDDEGPEGSKEPGKWDED